MKTRRFVNLILFVFLTVFMCGCGKKNDLLQDVDLSNGLYFYSYDVKAGEGYQCTMTDASIEKKMIEELSKVSVKKVDDWNHDKLNDTIYGMKAWNAEGEPFQIAWSNGYCITATGEAYTFEYDFENFFVEYNWILNNDFTVSTYLPCARVLSESDDGWIVSMLTPAEQHEGEQNICMVITGQEDNSLIVNLTNNGTGEWAYGESFSVEVLLDGTWYMIPTIPGEWIFPEIAIILPEGRTQTETCKLDMYGELPTGTYRLVKDDMVAEFEVD